MSMNKFKIGDVVVLNPNKYDEKMLIDQNTKMTVEGYDEYGQVKTVFMDPTGCMVYRLGSLSPDMLDID